MKHPFNLQETIEKARSQAKDVYLRGDNADEFLPVATVGQSRIYVAASHDHPIQSEDQESHANPRDCFVHILEGCMYISFIESSERHEVKPGEGITIGKGVEHWAHFPTMTIYLAIVDEGRSVDA